MSHRAALARPKPAMAAIDRLQCSGLVAFVHARQEDGWKPRSIASQLTIFRMFWRDLLAEERVSNGTILQVETPVADAPLPRYLTNIESAT